MRNSVEVVIPTLNKTGPVIKGGELLRIGRFSPDVYIMEKDYVGIFPIFNLVNLESGLRFGNWRYRSANDKEPTREDILKSLDGHFVTFLPPGSSVTLTVKDT